MDKNRFTFCTALAAFSVLLLASFFMIPAVPAEARNIKVGVIDAYTGPAAVFAKDALNGFKLAVDEINKKGVLGGKIEYHHAGHQVQGGHRPQHGQGVGHE